MFRSNSNLITSTLDRQDGLTPLQTVKNQRLQLALLKAGANPNVADKKGNTLMHTTESTKLMAALLKNGGNPHITNEVNRLS